MIRRALLLSFAALFLATSACSDSASPDSPRKSAAPPAVINQFCPVCPKEQGPLTEPTVILHDGKAVGFCCPMCVERWNVLSDEEKAARLSQ